MPGKTTRKTSNKRVTAKVKPTKSKKKKGSKTLTAALNTYKSVKNKIFPKKRKSKKDTGEQVEDIPVYKRMELVGIEKVTPGERRNIITDINEKMDTPGNRERGYINPNDDAIDSELLNERKLLPEYAMTARRKKKKDNTLLYIIIAIIAAYAIYKMTAKK